MPDASHPRPDRPLDWTRAFAALPQEAPPAQGWQRVSARLDVRRRNRLPAWIGFAAAAALVLAVTPWEQREPQQPAEPSHARLPSQKEPTQATADNRKPEVRVAASAAPAKIAPAKPAPEQSVAPLYDLYAESAQLEALLALARDDRVSSAGAALLADELDAQVAAIDASLAQPGLDDGERLRLWRARVGALRQAAGFESTQRLLASQGRSDVMLVSVD